MELTESMKFNHYLYNLAEVEKSDACKKQT